MTNVRAAATQSFTTRVFIEVLPFDVENRGLKSGGKEASRIFRSQPPQKQGKRTPRSFFFAETQKYLYLLFAPPATLDFDSIVFNTEAHGKKRNLPH